MPPIEQSQAGDLSPDSWPDGPDLPGATVSPDLPDDAVEPPVACACAPARQMTPHERLAEQSVSAVLKKLERAWTSTLTWHESPWLQVKTHATKISIRLSDVHAFEAHCDSRAESLLCDGGVYLEGNLTAHTEDGLLRISAPVRMRYGPPAAIKLQLNRSVLSRQLLTQPPQQVMLSLFPDAKAPGALTAYGAVRPGADEATWSEFASWP